MIQIKKAKVSDSTIIAILGRITYTESHGKFIENKKDLISYNNKAFSIKQIESEIIDTKNIFYLAFIDDFPVGYAKIVKNAQSEHVNAVNICRLERVYVLNEFLKMKIGSKLLKTVLKKASELLFDEIWLTTYIKNNNAINFYKRNNFRHIGDYTFKVGEKGYKNYVFSKKL